MMIQREPYAELQARFPKVIPGEFDDGVVAYRIRKNGVGDDTDGIFHRRIELSKRRDRR
jgi:hypothetical protein